MSLDANQFLQTFIEESLESLQSAESVLLNINLDNIDMEKINLLFRCTHSIKSSSAVFSFNNISQFSHTLETFLDKCRSGKHILSRDEVNLLLQAIDCLTSMIVCIKDKKAVDDSESVKLKKIFEEKNSQIQAPEVIESEEVSKKENGLGFVITLTPNKNFFETGSDPLPLFEAISELGKIEVTVNISQIPDVTNFNPNECYISWCINIITNKKREEISSILEWVFDKSNFSIYPILSETKTPIQKVEFKEKELSKSFNPSLTSIRIATKKIDKLINIVGELVVAQSILNQVLKETDLSKMGRLQEGLEFLELNFRELQTTVLGIRMVPIDYIFSRIPRLAHDLAEKLGKEVEIVLVGEQTELDKSLIEKFTDPLVHLVRNAVDHGIEVPEIRTQNGKPTRGTISLHARQESGEIVIDVSDDGGGIDGNKVREKAIQLGFIGANDELKEGEINKIIFMPGFSTANSVSDISGRGVGLDVVYKNIRGLGGEINVESVPGKSTTFRLRLPLTLAIMDCQLVNINDEIYIIPLMAITEIITVDTSEMNQLDTNTNLYHFRGEYIPIVNLKRFFKIRSEEPISENNINAFLIVIETGGRYVGLLVDKVLSQQAVVVKSLTDNYLEIPGIQGVTILGDGKVALIIDVKVVAETVLEKLNNKIAIDELPVELPKEKNNIKKDNKDQKIQIISFLLAGKKYGVNIEDVNEIIKFEKLTKLPNAPAYIKGIVNMRGEIIPILDLCERFELQGKINKNSNSLIVLSVETNLRRKNIGIIVDEVKDTYHINAEDITDLPENKRSNLSKHVLGLTHIDNSLITLISANNLLIKEFDQEETVS